MSTQWSSSLSPVEQALLIAIYRAGVSPTSWPKKADRIILDAIQLLRGNSVLVAEIDVGPGSFFQQCDDSLVGLTSASDGRPAFVCDALGDWRTPCYPPFRECRLTDTGQKLVFHALQQAGQISVPELIQHSVLGSLAWVPDKWAWQAPYVLPSGTRILLGLYQHVPGLELDLGPAAETLLAIKQRERDLSRETARRLHDVEVWVFLEEGKRPTELALIQSTDLVLEQALLCADGGGEHSVLPETSTASRCRRTPCRWVGRTGHRGDRSNSSRPHRWSVGRRRWGRSKTGRSRRRRQRSAW